MIASELEPFLAMIAGLLSELGIPHMVVGSFASTAYSSPRTTYDLDMVLDASGPQLDALLAGIDHDRYYVDDDVARDALQRRSMFNIIDLASGWKLDLIIRKHRAFSITELARRRQTSLVGVPIAMATAEDVILAKLEWAKHGGSERQLRDVSSILASRGHDIDRDYIQRWLDELDVRELWNQVTAT